MADQTQTAAAPAAAANAPVRNQRRSVQGVVVSAKMQKTITVETSFLRKHRKYGKYIKKYTTYKVHDEEGKAKEGDFVEIVQTRPLSKTKRYRLLRIIRSAQV